MHAWSPPKLAHLVSLLSIQASSVHNPLLRRKHLWSTQTGRWIHASSKGVPMCPFYGPLPSLRGSKQWAPVLLIRAPNCRICFGRAYLISAEQHLQRGVQALTAAPPDEVFVFCRPLQGALGLLTLLLKTSRCCKNSG